MINKVVDGHLTTCIYTEEKVRAGMEKYQQMLKENGGNMNMVNKNYLDTTNTLVCSLCICYIYHHACSTGEAFLPNLEKMFHEQVARPKALG